MENSKYNILNGFLSFKDADIRDLFKDNNKISFSNYFEPSDLSDFVISDIGYGYVKDKYTDILLITHNNKYYICNRNQDSIFGLNIPQYVKWWGFPLSKIYDFTTTDVKVICNLYRIGNENHIHQARLNRMKDDFREVLSKDYPQLLENEHICDLVMKDSVRPFLKRMKSRRRQLLSLMKGMSSKQIQGYINELKIIFADNPGDKTPVIDFCYNDGSVIEHYIIDKRYNDNFPRFHCNENYLRYEALPYVAFCKRYFKFNSEEDMFNKIRTVSYYWNIYAVYVCCFLEGFGDYNPNLISNDNKKNIDIV